VSEPLFVNQQKLESWIEEGEVTFEDNVLTILAEQKSYVLAPAVKVLGLLDGEDSAGLVGRTWAVADIEAKGGEHYRDSVILGETAYQCEEGFVGTRTQEPAAAAPAAQPSGEEQSDADLLTEFLLKHL
jgi:hypothetical protein